MHILISAHTYSNEEVLVIYFYCFHLEEFAKEEVS